MTIAVTGATGQLGTLVIDSLLQRTDAANIVAIARDAAKAQALSDKGVDVRLASYEDPDALRSVFAGIDTVLLISGNEFGKREAQHRTVIDAAIAQGVSRLVYTSVLAADSSTNPVVPEHKATEAYLASAGIDHVVLRNGWYNENYLGTVDAARETGSVLTSAGDGRVASATRADYAEAAAAVLTADGPVKRVYELSGDVAWTNDDLAAALTDVLGSPVSVAQVAPEQHTAILTDAGLEEGVVGFLVGSDASIQRGDLSHTTGDLSALIGRPTTPIADTLRTVA